MDSADRRQLARHSHSICNAFKGGLPLLVLVLALTLVLLPAGSAPAARNVIFVIGDGMGFNQVAAARIASQSSGGAGPNGRLHMDRLPYTAIVNTSSLSGLITDSAAAGTALACGRKTRNGWLATVPEETSGQPRRLVTLLEQAQQQGRATGLVTTTAMTHATPAAFAAHVSDRGEWDTIAEQYLTESRPDLLLGGGLQYFLPPKKKGAHRQERSPAETESDQGLLDVARENGYHVCLNRQELASARDATPDKVLGLFAPGHLPYEADRPSDSPVPELKEMTRFALDFLSRRPQGFFLMVEGGRIDHVGHSAWHDFDEDGQKGPDDPEDRQEALRRSVAETLALDRAVAEILQWMERQEEDDTLLLVTADHETGGLELLGQGEGYASGPSLPRASWATTGHTASDVPAYATGEGAAGLHGYLDNTDIYRLLARSLAP